MVEKRQQVRRKSSHSPNEGGMGRKKRKKERASLEWEEDERGFLTRDDCGVDDRRHAMRGER